MIKIVEDSGFCYGVRAAVHKADGYIEELAQGGKVYLYGNLVNNRQVMERYEREGFVVAIDAEEFEEGSTVIIRAHGVSKAVYDELAKKNVKIVDCTCVKVKSIHKIVSKKKGFRVIIVGKSKHPEVLGIHGWCDEGVVVETEEELITAISETPLCVVGQTTCNKAWWEKAVEIVKAKRPNAEIYDTLCDVTARRIENAVETAKVSDAMVVVGDKKSANSLELFQACEVVCKKVFFVTSLNELLDTKAMECEISGDLAIAGSASTPSQAIEEIHDFLFFTNFLARTKAEIETACDEYFKDLLEATKEKPFIEAALRDLHNQNQGGKRLRGALIKLGEIIAGVEETPNCKNIAMAYEIFQTAILIHDDIIDKSETRRGKKTIHASESEPHFGISRAICIGDYGLFLANKILAESGLSSEILAKVFRLFSEIQLKTLEGEIMDVSLPSFPIDITAEYDEYSRVVRGIYESKTAWYTLAGPIMLGAICGGASEELLNLLRDITLPLGMAFQIKDDMLGVFASEKVLGKPALSDIIEKKQTVLYGYAQKHATPEQKLRLKKSYGNPCANSSDLETVREIFIATGAKNFVEIEILRFSQKALKLINDLDNKHKPPMRGLVYFLLTRGH